MRSTVMSHKNCDLQQVLRFILPTFEPAQEHTFSGLRIVSSAAINVLLLTSIEAE